MHKWGSYRQSELAPQIACRLGADAGSGSRMPWSNEDFERELLLLLSSGCQLLLLLSSGCQLSPRLVLALVAGGRPSHIAARPPALQKWGAKASLPKRQKWGSALGQP